MKLKPAPTPVITGPSSGGSVSLRPVFGTGPKGDTGDQGETGPQGEQGPAGYNATGAAEDLETLTDYVNETAGPNDFASALKASIDAVADPIAARDNVDFFVDFTTQANGDPLGVLDTGQTVDFLLQNVSNRKPQIVSGSLRVGTLPGSGSFANYYQASCGETIRAAGARWTVDSSDGSTTEGLATIAMWANVYEAAGTVVPKTPAHITISTTTSTWAWWVSDGGGTGSTNLKQIKSGTFTAPASDGTTVWEVGVYIDTDNAIGYLYLPGIDATTGTRWVTLTETEINTFLVGVSLPTTTYAALVSGSNVLMVEHFANTAANTARYPRFLTMWGEAKRSARDAARALRQKLIPVSVPAVPARYCPTTRLDVATTTSLVAVDSTNAKTNACVVGASGSVLLTALFEVEVTTAELYFVRMTGSGGGATNSILEASNLVVGKQVLYFEWLVTGLTPGTNPRWVLSHQSITTAGAVTVRAGGSGSTLRRAIFLKAIPQG